MKPPHVIKGYSKADQDRVTKTTIKALKLLGFEDHNLTALHKMLDVCSPYSIIVQPPDTQLKEGCDGSWQFIFWDRNTRPNGIWIGGDGTLSFSAKWATPNRVLAAAMTQIYNAGYRLGVSHIMEGVTAKLKKFNEEMGRI